VASNLRLTRCNDPLCAGGDERVENIPVTVVFSRMDFTLDAFDRPAFAMRAGPDDLAVLRCNDLFCAGGDDVQTTMFTTFDGFLISCCLDVAIRIRSNDLPVVAFSVNNGAERFEFEAYDRVIGCNDPLCSGGDEVAGVQLDRGFPSSQGGIDLELDSADRAVVFQVNTLYDVHICDNPACSTVTTVSYSNPNLGGGRIIFETEDFELRPDGAPAVSFFSQDGDYFVQCQDRLCATESGFVLPDWPGRDGELELDSANRPVVLIGTEVFTTFPAPCNGLAVTVDIGLGDVPTGGDDVIRGTAGPDVIDALGGDDIVCADGGDDVINGGDGDDVIFGDEGDDRVNGGAGSDTVEGGDGDDTLVGAAGDDSLFGRNGADDVAGNGGNDELRGGDGNDRIFGGSGSDEISGGAGNDVAGGGSDIDRVRGGTGNDRVAGGGGSDLLLSGGDGDDTVIGSSGDDPLIYGGIGNDSVAGNGGDDILFGEAGNDTMFGGPGDDRLYGGPNDDSLRGNDGIDLCDGGPHTTFDTAASNCETIVNVP
jgi:hypothetical protein